MKVSVVSFVFRVRGMFGLNCILRYIISDIYNLCV